MIPQPAGKMCVSAANRRVRNVRERLFPPTWVEALRRLKDAHSESSTFSFTPADLLHELLIPTTHGSHDDNPEDDFQTWFLCRHEFGKLLCLYDAMSHVAVRLNLSDASDPDFAESFEIAARVLDSSGDRDIALVCLDSASNAKNDDGTN